MVSLRALEPNDVNLLYSIENDSSLWILSQTNMPYSREFLSQYILSTTGDIYTDKQLRLVIESEGKPVGLIDLQNFAPQHGRAEVGIIIIEEHRRKHIATQALSLLAQYASKTLHLHQLYAIIPASNIASIELFKKSGFGDDLTLRDWLYDGEKYENAIVLQKFYKKSV